MSRCVQISEHGGPEVLRLEEVNPGRPLPGQLLIEQRVIGVNFRDIYERRGQYLLPLPSGLGMEASGVVLEAGPDTKGFSPGDRVAYGLAPGGAYAASRCVDANRVVHLPESIGFDTGAAIMLKGMTVEYLLERCYSVQPGQWVLFHSISGGVGLLACQWLKALGARVIGTVGSESKVESAQLAGCDHVIVRSGESFEDRVRDLTQGAGASVVYDPIGRETLEGSLRCVAKRGTLVSFGAASGPPAPIALEVLARDSIFVCRPGLDAYIGTRAELLQSSARVFEMINDRDLSVHIGQRFALEDVRGAHEAVESGATCGASVLLT